VEENNEITNFTAADIEKYWTGKLSPSEMHAMEKAAMDDPFLADALEGYKNTATASDDLKSLREKLDERLIALAPVIPIKRNKFSWLRVAVAIIILAGIGLLVQQLVFKPEAQNAVAEREKKKEEKGNDVVLNKQQLSPTNPASPTTLATQENQGTYFAVPLDTHITTRVNQKFSNSLGATIPNGDVKQDTLNATFDLIVINDKEAKEEKKDSTGENAVAKTDADGVKDRLEERPFRKSSADSLRSQNLYKPKTPAAQDEKIAGFEDKWAVAPKRKFAETNGVLAGSSYGINLTNRYNYRVVDAQNNPVPFANVMNVDDKVGTYTDIRGNFNLVSSDSVLNVQIKSLGYESNNYRLVPSSQIKSLTLKEDYYGRLKILDSNRLFVSNVIKKDTAELEEPEDGWGNFNTYVANNIQIPETIRKKNTLSNVELSFDVDKNGNPTNIKITKSSQCKECDEEAKRLLKEGPKWKKKGRRSKTTISIAVDQK
jgi:TonB family protein